jgi:prepilin-type N-terminal cleavage/methylation domain-containing protein
MYCFCMKNVFIRKSKRAFTLIEISVVLLVLAFLVGGILISRKIVDRSKAQSIMTEFTQTKKAIAVFRDTYDYLPGDIPQDKLKDFTEFSDFAASGTCAYNGGNSAVYKLGDGSVNYPESLFGWRQLEIAGFLNGVPNAPSKCDSASAAVYLDLSIGTAGNLLKKSKFSNQVIVMFGKAGNSSSAAYFNMDIGCAVPELLTATAADGTTTNISLYTTSAGLMNACINGTVGVSTNAVNGYSLGEGSLAYAKHMLGMMSINATASAAVSAAVAKIVDTKIDDGLPLKGNFIGSMLPVNVTGSELTGFTSGYTAGTVDYCHTLDASKIMGHTNTTTQMAAATYQISAPNSLQKGCNVWYRLNID